EYLRAEAAKTALDTPFRNGTVLYIARQAVDIAELGLKNRDQVNGIGEDERIFLADLRDIADSGMTRAAWLLEAYENAWGENIDDVYAEMSY
ncbi:MAG: glutamate--cysteine ligase, partial [Pseudomonadota bacterium]|nr:glutamate--cysteine ligase [Pseudomonadota bacterium]